MGNGPTLIAEFMMHFNELRRASNDSPKTLITFFRDKSSLRALSNMVSSDARTIEYVINAKKSLIIASPQFIFDWKDYCFGWKKEVEFISSL